MIYFIYITFLKSQNYRDGKQPNCQGLGIRESIEYTAVRDCMNEPCDVETVLHFDCGDCSVNLHM